MVSRQSHKLLFLGSDAISSICLSALRSHSSVSSLEVISPSLSTPLAEAAQSFKLPLFTPAVPHPKMLEWDLLEESSMLWKRTYDFMVVASFGHFIPERLLTHIPATLNMHPSLLPKYRGASPIQHSILQHEKTTGVSIITLHSKSFDKGKVLLQEEVAGVDMDNVTFLELSRKLAELGGRMICKTIDEYETLIQKATEQDEKQATKAPKFDSQLGVLTCSETAKEIYVKFRALFGTSVRPAFTFRNKRLIPLKLRLVTENEEKELKTRYPKAVPGSIWVIFPALNRPFKSKSSFLKQIDQILYIRTGDGWLALPEFIIAGKPLTRTTCSEFIAAYIPQRLYQNPASFVESTGSDIAFS